MAYNISHFETYIPVQGDFNTQLENALDMLCIANETLYGSSDVEFQNMKLNVYNNVTRGSIAVENPTPEMIKEYLADDLYTIKSLKTCRDGGWVTHQRDTRGYKFRVNTPHATIPIMDSENDDRFDLEPFFGVEGWFNKDIKIELYGQDAAIKKADKKLTKAFEDRMEDPYTLKDAWDDSTHWVGNKFKSLRDWLKK